MIVTLTPHPTLHRILTVPGMSRGGVNQSTHSLLEPGGFGVMVARALLAHDSPTTAVLPMGGVTGQVMELLLRDLGVRLAPVPIAGSLPVSTTVLENDGTTTTFQGVGVTLDPGEASALLARADDLMRDADWMVAGGPLASGMPEDFYATAIRRAHTYGTQVAVSAHGRALWHALAAGPDLISVTDTDLAEVLGREIATPADAHGAGEALIRRGIPTVVITIEGERTMLLTDHGSFHTPVTGVPLSQGAGARPALLAGVLHGLNHGVPIHQALADGVDWAAAAAPRPDTQPSGEQPPFPGNMTGARTTGRSPSQAA